MQTREFIFALHREARPFDQRPEEVDWRASKVVEAVAVAAGVWRIPKQPVIECPETLPAGAGWAMYEAENPTVPVVNGKIEHALGIGETFDFPLPTDPGITITAHGHQQDEQRPSGDDD